jgi:predicted nucleic acid-binding protein
MIERKVKPAFWDSSALAPLCVSEPTSLTSAELAKSYEPYFVSWTTPVEIRSAISRLRSQRKITEADSDCAVDCLDRLKSSWREVRPSVAVRDMAETLPGAYGLKAADSLQLAAALIWCREQPRNRPFICYDLKLAEAARQAGFTVVTGMGRA